jgi:hypothetical protein
MRDNIYPEDQTVYKPLVIHCEQKHFLKSINIYTYIKSSTTTPPAATFLAAPVLVLAPAVLPGSEPRM